MRFKQTVFLSDWTNRRGDSYCGCRVGATIGARALLARCGATATRLRNENGVACTVPMISFRRVRSSDHTFATYDGTTDNRC